jgi:hypothetical protein
MRSEPIPSRRTALAIFLALVCAVSGAQGQGIGEERRAPAPGEYAVKAAFVYNFINFVEWPSPPGDTIRLCILGELPDGAAFERLNGREVRGMRLTVVPLRTIGAVRNCEILFLAGHLPYRLSEVLARLSGSPTLTISDSDGFARRGVMINMFLHEKRIRFEVNDDAARAAGLGISSKLLRLASKVYGAGGNR